MRVSSRIKLVGLFGMVALLSACGISQSEHDAVKQQAAAAQREAAAAVQQLEAQRKEMEALVNNIVNIVEKRANEIVEKRLNEVDTKLAVWAMQPGTAPRMNELAHYFNNMWYAARAGNWGFAEFEVYRTDETVKAIKTVRPARAEGMDKWMSEDVEPLREAVRSQQIARFIAAYDQAIAGCNSCHVTASGGGFPLKGVKVTRPTSPIYSNLDYRGN